MSVNPYLGVLGDEGSSNHLGNIVLRLSFEVSVFGQFPEVFRAVTFHGPLIFPLPAL